MVRPAVHPLLQLAQECLEQVRDLQAAIEELEFAGQDDEHAMHDWGVPGLPGGTEPQEPQEPQEPDMRVHTDARQWLVGAVQGLVQRDYDYDYDYGDKDPSQDWEAFIDRVAFDHGDELTSNGLGFTELRLLCRPPSSTLAERLALVDVLLLDGNRDSLEQEAMDAGPHWVSLWKYITRFASRATCV